MTSGMVIEVQRECLDGALALSGILRKARAVASKLDLTVVGEWIRQEMDGYERPVSKLPDHRKGRGSPKFWNPYRGYCPIMIGPGPFADIASTVYLSQSIAEMEALTASSNGGSLITIYPPEFQRLFHEQMDMAMECSLHFSVSQLQGAIDFTRNKLLDWTLELEKQGIVGAQFSFNRTEKAQARTAMNNFYNTNIGVFGNVAGDANATHFVTENGAIDMDAISAFIKKASDAAPGLPSAIRSDAVDAIQLVRENITSKSDQSIIRKALSTLKEILVGASGDLVADALIDLM